MGCQNYLNCESGRQLFLCVHHVPLGDEADVRDPAHLRGHLINRCHGGLQSEVGEGVEGNLDRIQTGGAALGDEDQVKAGGFGVVDVLAGFCKVVDEGREGEEFKAGNGFLLLN